MSGSFVSRGGVSYNKNGEKDYVNLVMQYIIITNAEWQTGADQCTHLKGHCHEHRFKNSRGKKHIFQQREPTNTGPVLIKITMPV